MGNILREYFVYLKIQKSGGVSSDQKEILLAGPDHQDYWDTWNTVLNNAYFIDPDTNMRWYLYQGDSGDLFAVIEGYDMEG